jgi:GntR family transcriptional regulator, transcriptional repressor for pyruvate dehydrogenase complex
MAVASQIDERSIGTRVPKAAELVAARLRREIVRGEIREGSNLAPEAELVARFGVSRPTFREAIRILESESLISVTRGARGGAKIHPPDVRVASRYMGLLMQYAGATLEELYSVRVIVEPPAARLLAENIDDDKLEILREIIERERLAVDDSEEFAVWVTRFHECVAELTGNKALGLMVGVLHDVVEMHTAAALESRATADPDKKMRLKSIRSEEKLVELLARGDGKAAEAHWRGHIMVGADVTMSHTGRTTRIELF